MNCSSDQGIPDPVEAFTPKMDISEEFQVLKTARKSLGGDALRPIEIDMDVLVDAYPREGNFLATCTTENSSGNENVLRTPIKPQHSSLPLHAPSARKTPNRNFFKSEHEREYARNLMKELVQIYILQGVHGKEAFRKALNETRKRIHMRRGEPVPTPPPVLSPIQASPYPKLSPPKPVETPYSGRAQTHAADVSPTLPIRKFEASDEASGSPVEKPLGLRALPPTPRTPSRVLSMVAAIQSSTPATKAVSNETPKRTPGTTRVKAVAETLESANVEVSNATRTRTRSTPLTNMAVSSPKKAVGIPDPGNESVVVSPRKLVQSTASPVKAEQSPMKKTPPSKRKNQLIIEKASTTRGRKKEVEVSEDRAVSPPADDRKRIRRAAAIAAEEELTAQSAKKSKKSSDEPSEVQSSGKKSAAPKKSRAGTKRKKASVDLETIPEDEAVAMPPRPVRKAKLVANEGLIKM